MSKAINLFLEKTCEQLEKDFYSLKTTRDVANLLEVPYNRLIYHIYRIPSEDKYEIFRVPKKSGGEREITAPISSLKIIQRKLSQVLYCTYHARPSVHGFMPTKNIVSNALCHSNKRYVLNIDIKDFFPSINFGRVRGLFLARPYSLPEPVSTCLATICCHNNELPQGSPSSPVVSNMICSRMDGNLQKLAQKHRCTYTRYADDITFSTTTPTFPESLAYYSMEEGRKILLVGDGLSSVIESNGFSINTSKVRLQNKKEHQEVTGLTVNA